MKIPMETFSSYVGETLMYCQCIEHDIKEIFLSFCKGQEEEFRKRIEEEKWTLGMTVTALKEIDHQSSKPLFQEVDYSILFSIVRLRNYYAHQVYLTFCYEDEEDRFEEAYNKAADRLISERKLLASLYGRVEDVRIFRTRAQ